MTMTVILIFVFMVCTAPEWRVLYIHRTEPINPYELIWKGVYMVESGGNPKAYNAKEQAVGLGQVRPIRLRDFNRQTGKHYTMKDMYDPVRNKEVFMYFAVKLEDPNLIIRKWNGSGPMTYVYLKKVKKEMKLLATKK